MRPHAAWHPRLDGAIEACWLGALLLTPLAATTHHARPFPDPKAAVVCLFAVLGVTTWSLKVLTGGAPWRPLGGSRLASAACRRLALGLAMLSLSLALGAALSIAPRLALHGVNPRSLGAVTQLSVLALAGLAFAHLRTREQALRLVEVVALASVPVCLYALLQAFGLDPLFEQVPRRPYSLEGNANILARFLLPAVFLTFGLLLESASETRTDLRVGVRQGLLLGLLGLQGWTLLATGSRAAALGAAAGVAIATWGLWWLARRGRAIPSGATRWLVTLAAITVLGFAVLGWHHGARQAAGPPEAGSPLTRGVGGMFDSGSRTAQVRLSLWRAAWRAYTDDTPLEGAAGLDPLASWRPWIGHGPGLAGPPLVRASDAELASLEPKKVPDHAHNHIWEILLTGGAGALLGWLLVQGGLVELFLIGVGRLRAPDDAAGLWGSLVVGSLVGTLAASLAAPGSGLAAPSATAGALLGVGLFALGVRRAQPASRDEAHLACWAAAACGARLVAGQFGIDTVTDQLFLLLPAMVLLPAVTRRSETPAGRQVAVVPLALPGIILWLVWTMAWTRHAALGAPVERAPSPALAAWLVVASILLVAGLGRPGDLGSGLAATLAAIAAGVGVHSLSTALLAGRVASGALPWAVAIARHEMFLAAAVLGVSGAGAVFWAGARLEPAGAGSTGPGGKVAQRRVALLLAAAVACVLLAALLRPLAAGFALQAARRAQGVEPAVALELARSARRMGGDPVPAAVLEARIEQRLALSDSRAAERDAHLARAGAALEAALAAAPYNSDLLGNLGLLELERMHRAPPEQRPDLADRARARFEAALRLRPIGGPWGEHLALATLVAEPRSDPAADPP